MPRSLIIIFKSVLMYSIVVSCAYGENCFNDANTYENKAQEDGIMSSDYYDKAYASYLCAAKLGNAEAAYRAALLAQSGQVQADENDRVETLLIAAAEGGHIDARVALANFYCGINVNHCLNSQLAKFHLVIAAKSGSPDGTNMLGSFYERGWGGSVDLDKAIACYIRASELGNYFAKKNLERITANSKSDKHEKIGSCF